MILDGHTKKEIIAELGIEKLSQDKAGEVMTKLEDQIQRKVVLDILDLLKPEEQKQLMSIAEPGDNDEVFSFLADKLSISVIKALIKASAESAVKEFKNSIK